VHHRTLLVGLARAIADADLGVWNEDAVYTTEQRGIVLHAFPETPDELISLTLIRPEYSRPSPTADRRLVRTSVQIRWRIRGNPLDGIDLFDALNHLIDQKRLDFDGQPFRGEYRNFAPTGQDSNHRVSFSSNWQLNALEAI
jgi:hypothetical protein